MLFLFAVFALTQQSPKDILQGLLYINTSRGVLITDYIKIGGIGAALMNGVIVGTITLVFLIRQRIVPTGATLMAMCLTFGFALFGKNILNMIPITFGVWLFSRFSQKPFANFYLTALLAATISPITSEIIFLDISHLPVNIFLGIGVGALAGFLFPLLSEYISQVHGGYNLYNLGFVGGLIATFFIAILRSLDVDVQSVLFISEGNNLALSILMYVISLFFILCAFVLGDRRKILPDMCSITKLSGKLRTDFYEQYGANTYMNMGILCALGTTLILLLGAQLNGPVIAGIMTITGFGAFGKHIRNTFPLVVGAIIATQINKWDPTHSTNVLTILFCTGLAPIAGQHGVLWGIFAGFLHVCIAHHIGYLNSGLNLYNNGFAAGFVVLILIPIIEGIAKKRTDPSLDSQ